MMTLTLDPRRPVLWRTPHSLQVGLDNPPVMISGVTLGHERMLAGLAIGLTPAGLALIGREAGLTDAQVEDFARDITPALTAKTASHTMTVEIDGVGATADRLGYRLREAGFELGLAASHDDHVSDFAVITGDYVLDPERRGKWLRRDIPHLPLVYSDLSVTIGPFIEPGAGPCLYCLELHHRQSDEAWPALASQLLGKSSSAPSPFIASEAATLATRAVLRRARYGPESVATSITLNIESGDLTSRSWQAHPECACAGLHLVSGSGRQGIAKENSLLVAGRLRRTTTDEAASVPA